MRKLCLFGIACSAAFSAPLIARADVTPLPALSATPPAHHDAAPAPLLPLTTSEPKFFGLKGVMVRHIPAQGMPRPDTIEAAHTIAAPLPVHLSKASPAQAAKNIPAPTAGSPSPLHSKDILDIFGAQPTVQP